MHRVEEKRNEVDTILIQRIVQDIVQYFLQTLVTAREIVEVLLAEMVAVVAVEMEAVVEINTEMRLKWRIFLLFCNLNKRLINGSKALRETGT